jgi:hypothetical protein
LSNHGNDANPKVKTAMKTAEISVTKQEFTSQDFYWNLYLMEKEEKGRAIFVWEE